MSFHENYQLTDADKTAFQALESPDSRAFIIMMTEFAASDVIAYSNNPYGTEAENLLAQAIAQLEILQKTALKPHQLKDLASFVEHRASLWEVKHDAGAAISGLEATDFAQNLQSLARTLRQLDGESGYVGGTISHAPQETPSPTLELEQASYSRLQRF